MALDTSAFLSLSLHFLTFSFIFSLSASRYTAWNPYRVSAYLSLFQYTSQIAYLLVALELVLAAHRFELGLGTHTLDTARRSLLLKSLHLVLARLFLPQRLLRGRVKRSGQAVVRGQGNSPLCSPFVSPRESLTPCVCFRFSFSIDSNVFSWSLSFAVSHISPSLCLYFSLSPRWPSGLDHKQMRCGFVLLTTSSSVLRCLGIDVKKKLERYYHKCLCKFRGYYWCG